MSNGKNGSGLAELERRLWSAADQLWANSPLRPSQYSTPVLGLIFLRFADNDFTKAEVELKGKSTGRRTVGKTDYQARGVVCIPDEARFTDGWSDFTDAQWTNYPARFYRVRSP